MRGVSFGRRPVCGGCLPALYVETHEATHCHSEERGCDTGGEPLASRAWPAPLRQRSDGERRSTTDCSTDSDGHWIRLRLERGETSTGTGTGETTHDSPND